MGTILKKGQTGQDVLFFIIIVFALAVAAVATSVAYNEFYVNVQNVSMLNDTKPMEAFTAGQNVSQSWDYLILVVMIAFAIGVIVLGYFVDAASVWMPLFIIILIVGVLVAGIIQYIWDTIITVAVWNATVLSKFPITDHILTNLPIYYCIIAGLAMVATYAKVGGDNR